MRNGIGGALVMFPENTMGVIDVHSFGTILACLPVEEGRNVSPEANKNENRCRVKSKKRGPIESK